MEKNTQLNPQELQIQGLLDSYLAFRSENSQVETHHIDEDTLSAFIEGTLNKRESDPIISHLVDCGFCRNATAELVRLELALEGEPLPEATKSNEPAKISEVISGIFSKIFGTTEGAVFAHEDKIEKKDKEAENNPEEK